MTDTLPSGIALDELDPAIRPQDDLFRHVNGRWIERTEIPADKARWGSFMVLAEQAEAAVREIIEEAQSAEPGTVERKVGDLFTSFMDEDRVEALGVAPISAMVAEAQSIDSIPLLLETAGRWSRLGVSGFFGLFVDNDPGDPQRYVVFMDQGGLGLPDESYYREDKFGDIREQYRQFIEQMLQLAALDDPEGRAQRIVELETAIAREHWNRVDSRDSEKTYNLLSWRELNELAADVELNAWLRGVDALGGPFDEVVVRQPSFVAGLGGLLVSDQLPAWRDWLTWRVIRASAPYLSRQIVETNFDFYGRALTGTPAIRDRWKRGVALVESVMGEAVGRIYVDRHFPATAKSAMDELVANLIEAYRQSIEQLEWMGPETRRRALEKLNKFTPKIGFPAKWRDYSKLTIDPADLMGNVWASKQFEFQRELGKIGKPIDRDEWFMTPQTINAYYNPGFNEIVFPAAILQYPFFDENRDAAANYGAIGAVIGHEIGHGFDDQGSKFDGDGRLTDWWTDEDRVAFEQRTGSLIEQYNALAPTQVPEHHVNGALTIGENIGDLGGLGIAWKAYLLHLAKSVPAADGGEQADPTVHYASLSELAPVVDGLTGAQRFFLSWAQAWQMKGRDEEVIRLLAIDPHSPNEFRCNQIVRNIDAFYESFDVSETDSLWLDPKDRVTIW